MTQSLSNSVIGDPSVPGCPHLLRQASKSHSATNPLTCPLPYQASSTLQHLPPQQADRHLKWAQAFCLVVSFQEKCLIQPRFCLCRQLLPPERQQHRIIPLGMNNSKKNSFSRQAHPATISYFLPMALTSKIGQPVTLSVGFRSLVSERKASDFRKDPKATQGSQG